MAQVISFSFGYDDNFRGSSLIPWKFVWIETKISLFPRESSSEEQYQHSRCQKINKTITNVLSHSFVPFNFDILRHSMHMFYCYFIPCLQWFSFIRFCLPKKYLETFYNSVEAEALRVCYTTPEIVQQCFFHSMRFVYLFVDELSAKDNNSEIPLNILAAFVACHELSSIFSLCSVSFPTVKYDEDIKRMKNSRRWHQHQNKIWDFVEHFWAYFAYSLSLPLQNDMKLQMYRNAFHFICLASAIAWFCDANTVVAAV